jgi:hypothetical protein
MPILVVCPLKQVHTNANSVTTTTQMGRSRSHPCFIDLDSAFKGRGGGRYGLSVVGVRRTHTYVLQR